MDLLRRRRLGQKRRPDRELADPVGPAGLQHSRQRIGRRDQPGDLAAVDLRGFRVGVEKLRHRTESSVGNFLALEVLGLADPGVLEHENGMRRLGVDNGDELGRDLIIAAAENDCRRVRETELRGAGRDLLDRIRRPLPAHDIDLEILAGVISFVQSDEIVGMPAVVAEVGHEGDLVGRIGGRRRQAQRAEHRKHYGKSKSFRSRDAFRSPLENLSYRRILMCPMDANQKHNEHCPLNSRIFSIQNLHHWARSEACTVARRARGFLPQDITSPSCRNRPTRVSRWIAHASLTPMRFGRQSPPRYASTTAGAHWRGEILAARQISAEASISTT